MCTPVLQCASSIPSWSQTAGHRAVLSAALGGRCFSGILTPAGDRRSAPRYGARVQDDLLSGLGPGDEVGRTSRCWLAAGPGRCRSIFQAFRPCSVRQRVVWDRGRHALAAPRGRRLRRGSRCHRSRILLTVDSTKIMYETHARSQEKHTTKARI